MREQTDTVDKADPIDVVAYIKEVIGDLLRFAMYWEGQRQGGN